MKAARAAGVVFAMLAAASAACGGGADENVAAQPAAQPVAPPVAPPAPAPAVPLVAHEALAALVPNLPGWTHGPPTSATVSLPAPAAHATATYSRGKARIDLEITDTAGHPDYVGALAKIAGSAFSQKASNGYMKGTTIAGVPAVESWNHTDRLGDISLLVDRRFIIHATGTGLDRVETLKMLVEKVEIGKIK